MSRDYGGFWLWAMLKSLSFEMEWMECEREEDSGVVDGVDGVCVCVRDIGSVLVSMVSDVRGFRSRKMEYQNFRFTAIFKPFFERSTWVCFVMAVVSLFVNSFVGIYRVLGYREYLFF